MNPQQNQQNMDPERSVLPTIRTNSPSSTRFPLITTPIYGSQRKIAIAVDLSHESAYAVRWAVENYLRPGDAVVLLHVRPTSVLYGADWGFVNNHNLENDGGEKDSGETDLTASNAKNIAEPLEEARIPYKIHIVKDHDMKERLCLEVKRLQLSVMIMGSRGIGIGALKRNSFLGRLGSVSDYCVHHCVCPVIVIRYPYESQRQDVVREEMELHPVPEEETEDHDDVSE